MIKGFRFGEHEIKHILYADDFTLFIKDRSSVKKVKYVFEEVEKVSGLKVNTGKTNLLWMGKDNEKPQEPVFGKIVNEIKILAVHFTRNCGIKRGFELQRYIKQNKKTFRMVERKGFNTFW